ncbi:MAG: PQQ-binding-like beta-propeller repeat protein [Pirellulales bacterium]|nr:PQQ-binding-like beta-propeller repeat protein [Pirellulales bacterium]
MASIIKVIDMFRFWSLVGAACCLQSVAYAPIVLAGWIESPLLTSGYVESYGLVRGWNTQLAIDGARSKVKYIKLEHDLVLAVTSGGVMHVLDASTGIVNWTTTVGESRFQTLMPGANEKFIAAVNGDSLYIYDRASGRIAFRHTLRGTAEMGPVLTSNRVLVPIVNGPLESYPLDANPDAKILGPQQLPVAGRLAAEPATFNRTVVWGGDRDRLFGQEFGEKPSKFDTYIRFGIISGPVTFPPMVYVGTKAGFLVAYDREHGVQAWEFPTGSPIFHPPVPLANVVYALPQDGGMFAVNPADGKQMWFAQEPRKFVAASPSQVYTLDFRGRMAVIDAQTGARVTVMPLPQGLKPVLNADTDRIYFYTDGGLIQSLHEHQLVEPHLHEPSQPSEQPAEGEANPFTPGPGAPPAPAGTATPTEASPFDPPAAPAPMP